MPRNQLRTSGVLQAGIVALILGFTLKSAPATAETSFWPFLLGAYGFIAATAPWLAGGLSKSEFSLGYSAFLGLCFALPVSVAGYWLEPSAYRSIGLGCWLLSALWLVHLMVAIFYRFAGAKLS